MIIAIQCKCGAVKGTVTDTNKICRGVCYCRDCQAYARHLGTPAEVLDGLGGTDVVATVSKYVHIDQGHGSLGCLSLREGGLLRWYSTCCRTPIANTLRNPKSSYVGLVHSCLKAPGGDIDGAFGPVKLRLNTKNVPGKVAGTGWVKVRELARFIAILLIARVAGSSRRTPFFSATGHPIAVPTVLSEAELRRANLPA